MDFAYFLQGLTLGIAAGILPGPVMMFSLAQVIKSGVWAGFKVQLGATLMDVVRILITFFIFSLLPQSELLTGIISLLGGTFLLYMAYVNLVYKPSMEATHTDSYGSMYQGALGNILNSSAYIFWLTVGGPIIIKGGTSNGALFGLGFLVAITCIGGLIALLASTFKKYLDSKYYVYLIKLLGLVIIVFAFLFFKQAVTTLT